MSGKFKQCELEDFPNSSHGHNLKKRSAFQYQQQRQAITSIESSLNLLTKFQAILLREGYLAPMECSARCLFRVLKKARKEGTRELGPSWKPPRLAARPGDQVCCDLSQLRLRAHTSARSVWEVQDRHEDSEFVAYQKSSEKCRMWTCSRQNPSKKSVSKSGKVPMSGPPLVRNLPPVAGHITWSRHLYRPKWVMKTGKHGQFLCTFPLWIQ